MLLRILDEVDLHHGEFSHDPPWGCLEVVGTAPTAEIRAALADLGVEAVRTTPAGFCCSRKIEDAR